MTILSFRTKKDKEHLLEKARKMEEYAAMIVECIEDSRNDEDYEERTSYRHDPYYDEDEKMQERGGRMSGRYGYRMGR